MALLEIKKMSVTYRDLEVLHDVSLCIAEGDVIAVMGANGAGKSTLLKALFGLVESHGQVLVSGQGVRPSPVIMLRHGISYVPQGRRVFSGLTIAENLELGGGLLSRKERDVQREALYASFPLLRERRHHFAGTLSGGQQQILAIARGMMAAPRLLLLDEPTLGLSPRMVTEVCGHLKMINAEFGVTLLIVEHNVKTLLSITNRVCVLASGTVLLDQATDVFMKSGMLENVMMGTLTDA